MSKVDRPRIALALCLFASACSWSTEPECDICLTSAQLVGTVTSGGEPIAGATIFAEAGGACVFSDGGRSDESTVTSASGTYRLLIRISAPPEVRCVLVRMTPPEAAGLSARADTVEALRFRPEWKGPTVRDSARVDFALEPAP